MINPKDLLGTTAGREYELAVSSFGAIIWQLKRCLIEHELLVSIMIFFASCLCSLENGPLNYRFFLLDYETDGRIYSVRHLIGITIIAIQS